MDADDFREISRDKIREFLVLHNGKITNRELVRHFKKYLVHPETKDEARKQFKASVNSLATTRIENDEKFIILRPECYPEKNDESVDRNQSAGSDSGLGGGGGGDGGSGGGAFDSVNSSRNENASVLADCSGELDQSDQFSVSVKERTQKFNRLASQTDISSQNQRRLSERGCDEDDGASVLLDPKLIKDWTVKMSFGDYHSIAKMVTDHPSLIKFKDPYSSYNALHWAAKHGNADLVKLLAGKYHMSPNLRTNGGYTSLHIALQFGHANVYQLLVTVYGGDPEIRDYSGRKATHYISDMKTTNIQKKSPKPKPSKKSSDKESFLRIGSLNVKVKKTTEAFSNLILGHGSNTIGGGGGGGSGLSSSSLAETRKMYSSVDSLT